MYKQGFLLLRYSKAVLCILDQGTVEPLCTTVRRNNDVVDVADKLTPVNDPYIPRSDVKFFNCSKEECTWIKLDCISQVTPPVLNLQSCYLAAPEKYECELIRYNHFKNIDKLLFLSKNIPGKIFYMVDCLVYEKGNRICHVKEDSESHASLLDMSEIARPNETAILSQDEFVCQQSDEVEVLCDLNPYIPLAGGLDLKQATPTAHEILLKTGSYLVPLKLKCIGLWCGYKGKIIKTRRDAYQPPGGDIYRCYYAKRQQICKKISSIYQTNEIFNRK